MTLMPLYDLAMSDGVLKRPIHINFSNHHHIITLQCYPLILGISCYVKQTNQTVVQSPNFCEFCKHDEKQQETSFSFNAT